jgi:hypothetical protein
MKTSLILLAAAVGAAPAPVDFPRYFPCEYPPALRPAIDRAEETIRAAACDVERRFGEGDPDANATRCDRTARVKGVAVGRTSARRRNPENAPPDWARAYVAATDRLQAEEVAPVAYDLGDRVGILRPIPIRARCLACHAPREQLSKATRAWLERDYPEDRAVGYALGDLRGFWWAVAPKSAE